MSFRNTLRSAIPKPILDWRRKLLNRRSFGSADYGEIFKIVHETNWWRNRESVSGGGSTLAFTESIRAGLAEWLARHEIGSMVDLPCGDFNWMRLVQFPAGMRYTGIDIVPALIEANRAKYEAPGRTFELGDIIAGPVPPAEVYFCRDVFIHFPNDAVEQSIANVRATGARYLIASTFPDVTEKVDTVFPNSRRQNLALFLGEPEELLEDFGDGRTDKFMGVWKLG